MSVVMETWKHNSSCLKAITVETLLQIKYMSNDRRSNCYNIKHWLKAFCHDDPILESPISVQARDQNHKTINFFIIASSALLIIIRTYTKINISKLASEDLNTILMTLPSHKALFKIFRTYMNIL